MQKIYEFYKRFNELQNVLRAGWLIRNVPAERKEDDAHHTLQTIMLADLLVRQKGLKEVNLLRVAEMLLIHEIGEGIIGDVPMIADDYKTKKQREREAVQERLSCLGEPLASYYFSLWLEFEKRETIDAEFVYFVDHMDAVLKAREYDEKFGTDQYFNDFYPHAVELLKDNSFAYILDELKR